MKADQLTLIERLHILCHDCQAKICRQCKGGGHIFNPDAEYSFMSLTCDECDGLGYYPNIKGASITSDDRVLELREEIKKLISEGPPTVKDILDHLKNGGVVQGWNIVEQSWNMVAPTWIVFTFGNSKINSLEPQPGLRLVPSEFEEPF